MSIVYEIISRVHQDDIRQQEAQIAFEKAERKRIHAQQNASTYSISELLQKLVGEDGSSMDSMPKLQLNKEAANEQPTKRENLFPPPPTGPSNTGSGS